MRNRDKLNQMSIVDLLWKIHGNETNDFNCIIELLTGESVIKRCGTFYDEEKEELKCYECLCEWLNEKV